MKKGFTLIILFICLKLSAAVPPDTLKTIGPDHRADTSKLLAALSRPDSNKFKPSANRTDSIAKPVVLLQKDNAVNTVTFDPADNVPRLKSLYQLDSLKSEISTEQVRQANLRKLILKNEQIKLARILKINNLDSLKLELKTATVDTLKALLYTRIALKYLDYDTITNTKRQLYYQNQAINNTLQAIREYSIFNDSTALRMSFDNLAKVYFAQKKYSQAKWFILQSNTLSRAKNDTPGIISSLLTLSSVKSDIKDYDLAMQDLDEALQLSITTHSPTAQLQILNNYAFLYNKLQNYPKEALVLKKRDSLLDSMRKNEEALAAKEAKKKKLDSLQNKKKLFSSDIQKFLKSSSASKMASL